MKLIKILLILAALGAMGDFIRRQNANPASTLPVPSASNQYNKRIDSLILSLTQASINTFCQNRYKEINYYIEDYHKQGLFGNNANENNQWRELKSKDLYSAYASKFTEQAMYVFSGSEWRKANIDFIRGEVNLLQGSPFLEQGREVAKKFREIHSILGKYDEITNFIVICNNFSYLPDKIGDQFPDLSDKIQKSRAYLGANLENQYVNNCTRLKNDLREIPKKLFYEHTNYLTKKIENNSGMYQKYASQQDHYNQIISHLQNEINVINNSIYNIDNKTFNETTGKLNNLLSGERRKGFEYFRNQLNKQR